MVKDVFLVVGAGAIGKRHAGNLAALGASVDLIPYREFDAAQVQNRRDLAGMIIATATPIRLELIKLCAQMDLPFYVEKPLAWTTDTVAEIYATAAPVADRSMIGFMMRYHPALRAMAGRDLSDVYDIALEIGHDVRQWRPNWSFKGSYAAQAAGGGVLLDLCHELDLTACLFPDLTISATDCVGHADFPGVDFASRITLTGAGRTGTVSMDYISPRSLRRARLRGAAALTDIDWLTPDILTDDGHQQNVEKFTFDRNDMFLDTMRDFIALATGAPTSQNPIMPRFDRMRASCDLIAAAWQARQFSGTVSMEMT